MKRGVDVKRIFLAALLVTSTGCTMLPQSEVEARSNSSRAASNNNSIPVDVAIARRDSLLQPLEYTGTTEPIKQVTLRSQTEGQLLNLNVDIGDEVIQGQAIANIDNTLPVAAVAEARSELSARDVEVARAQSQVNEARIRVEQARVELEQAIADADRLETLFREGAVSEQDAELARTAARSAEQVLKSAREQVRTQTKVAIAARERVEAQQAIVAQALERQSHAEIGAPISGVVLARLTESGNLVRPGDEIIQIGDFRRVKVVVEISELQLANIRVGQSVQVTLDAFGDRQFPGEVTRISPAADPIARQIPVEIAIPNLDGRLGSGLLARVSFLSSNRDTIVIPATALVRGKEPIVFVVTGERNEAKVAARPVIVGKQADGRVEILSGLEPKEQFVLRSSQPLKDGDAVKLSLLSETS